MFLVSALETRCALAKLRSTTNSLTITYLGNYAAQTGTNFGFGSSSSKKNMDTAT